MALTVTEAAAHKTLAAGLTGADVAERWEQIELGRFITVDQALGLLAELAGWTTPADSADPTVVVICWCHAVHNVLGRDQHDDIALLEGARTVLEQRYTLPSYRDAIDRAREILQEA